MVIMRAGIWLTTLLVMPTSVLLGPQTLAQPNDPAAGLDLSPATYRSLIGNPPTPGSRQALDDLAILRWNQRTRTPEGVLHSWRFLNRNLSVFDAAMGTDLAKTSPILFKGLPAFLLRVDTLKDQIKDAVARPRPFVSYGDIQPCLPLETTWSYPSGHATWFATAALLLADVVPERRDRLVSVGLQGGYARAYCGVHYPSDVEASQRLGLALSKELIASPQWRKFKEQLAEERAKLLVAPPAGIPLLTD